MWHMNKVYENFIMYGSGRRGLRGEYSGEGTIVGDGDGCGFADIPWGNGEGLDDSSGHGEGHGIGVGYDYSFWHQGNGGICYDTSEDYCETDAQYYRYWMKREKWERESGGECGL